MERLLKRLSPCRRVPVMLSMILGAAAVSAAHAGGGGPALRGALWGAAAGALFAEWDDDTDARYAIPVFAGAGALTGYALHHQRRVYRRPGGPYRRDAYYLPYLALPYAYYHGRRPRRDDVRPWPSPASPAIRPARNPVPAADRHPGVRLVPVPVPLPNGTIIPVHIMQLGDRYIGPQGEAYKSLPSAAELESRYLPLGSP